MSSCLSVYFLAVFKTVLRRLWTFSFVGLKIVFLVLFVELGSLLTPFSFQALFSHVSLRGDCSCFCLILPCSSPSFLPSVLPSSSTLGLFTSRYTAILRITHNFLIEQVHVWRSYGHLNKIIWPLKQNHAKQCNLFVSGKCKSLQLDM